MWIFAFGSLMSDGWEKQYGCTQRQHAILSGYRRSFNKKSIKNWGTRDAPGITLNLEQAANGQCHGVAFAFPANFAAAAAEHLKVREACAPTEVQIKLSDNSNVGALAFIYVGRNLISPDVTIEERAMMAVAAKGTSGPGRTYVESVRASLHELGVEDEAVEALWAAIVSHDGRRSVCSK